ncbi:hypothetical protein N9L18_01270 [Candidatus Pacebacteria bacterium]|nr:hypothetical protein [Candidatus Paceibacterota bacterium]
MADEIRCIHCGHYETTHYDWSTLGGEESIKIEGYDTSLYDCEEFEPDPDLVKKVEEAEKDEGEKYAPPGKLF